MWDVLGSIAGGLLGGGDKPYKPSQNIMSSAKGARQAGEKYGFNPLALLGLGGSYPGSNGNPGLSLALSDAGRLADEKFGDNAAQQRLSQTERQNDYLAAKVNRLTLRPPVPGVYGSTDGAATGGAVPDDSGGSAAGVAATGFNRADPDIYSGSDDESKVPEKDLYFAGKRLPPNSGTSDAQAWGTRYGEDFMSPAWFAGWGSFALDTGKALRTFTNDQGWTAPGNYFTGDRRPPSSPKPKAKPRVSRMSMTPMRFDFNNRDGYYRP